MSLQFVDAAMSRTAGPASASSDDESSAAFSSCMSVRSRSSTIATTRSQSFSIVIDNGWSQHGFHVEDPEREKFYILAPSQSIVTASPRADPELEYSQQRSEGDGQHEEQDQGRRSSDAGKPPVAEVRIPLSAVARQGLIELSRDDWKHLYLSASKNLEAARAHVQRTHDENRKLKRKLIEMQKNLFEARRNRSQHLLRSVPDHLYPWSIPDSRRSVGNSPAAATKTTATAAATTRTAATSTALIVTSTASEEDSDAGPQVSYASENHHDEHSQQGLLLLPRPCKVQRRGSSPTLALSPAPVPRTQHCEGR